MRTPVVLLVALAGTASADALPPKAAPALTGFVLVWHDAHFIPDPAAPTATVQFATLDGERSENLGLAAPFKVISTRGDLVEVETVPDDHCGFSTVHPTPIAPIRLFVARTDLAPVLTKPFKLTNKDGTQLTLEPGTPLAAGEGGASVALVGLDPVVVDLPATSVGLSYPRVPPAFRGITTQKTARVYRAPAGISASVGAHTFTLAADLHGYRYVTAAAKGDTTLIPLRSRCATAKVAVATKDIVHPTEPASGNHIGTFGHGSGMGGPGSFVAKGTPLLSASGNRIATTTGTTRVNIVDDRACVELRASYSTDYLSVPHPKDAAGVLTACAKAGTKITH